MSIPLLTHQLEERETLKQKHLEELDDTLIYCHTKINALVNFYFGRHKGVDRTRDQLSQQVLNLEQQKRFEETTAWKDQTMLLKDFLEAWNGYRADLWTDSVLNPERINRSDSLK